MIREEWTLFPIDPDTRVPAIKWGELAPGEKIRREGCGIGLATGARSNLFVVDLDRKNGKDGVTAIFELGPLPETLRVRTRTGGVHMYFRHPGFPIKTSAGELGPGIDVRGEGGFVVFPGTPGYEWMNEGAEIADAPAWLLEKVKKQEKAPVKTEVRISGGSRNDTLTSVAGALRRRGLSGSAISAALHQHNLDACIPPLEAEEVEKIAQSVARYDPAADFLPGDFVIRDQDHIFAELEEPKYVISPIIRVGSLSLLGAYSGSGKTWLELDAAVALALGQPWAGKFETTRGQVGVIDYEQGDYETRRRLQLLARGRGANRADVQAVIMPSGFYMGTERFNGALERFCEGKVLVALDSLRAASLEDENDSKIRKGLDDAHAIAERTGCAVLIVLHAKKRGADGAAIDPREVFRGSSAIIDAADQAFAIGFHITEDGGIFDVEQVKTRHGRASPPFTFRLEDVPGPGVRVVAEDKKAAQINSKMKAFDRIRAENMQKRGAPKRLVEANVEGKAASIRAAIESLVSSGFVVDPRGDGLWIVESAI